MNSVSDTLLHTQRKQFHLSMGSLQMRGRYVTWNGRPLLDYGRDFRNLSPATGSWRLQRHIQHREIVYRYVLIIKLCWKILVLSSHLHFVA